MGTGTQDGTLQWHPAFAAALRIEFEAELDILEIHDEYPLSKKPMLVDVLVVKKEAQRPVHKNIGRIFRKHNIIEYKAPDDYLSINDFYKVYGYTCFYQADTRKVMEIDPEELTITFACGHYPRKMLQHLKTTRGLRVEKQESGIYYILGDMIPMQVLVTKKLSKEDNYWLSNLRNDLKAGPEIRELVGRYEAQKNDNHYQAVMDLIVRANWEQVKEEKEMCDALRELFAQELKESEEIGMQRGLQRGMERGFSQGESQGIHLAKSVFRLSAAGTTLPEIARQCGISVSRVKEILE